MNILKDYNTVFIYTVSLGTNPELSRKKIKKTYRPQKGKSH